MHLNYNISNEDLQSLSYNGPKYPFVQATIEEFLAIDQPIAKIEWQDQYQSHTHAAASFRSIVTHKHYPVRIIARKPNLYITRKGE